MALTARLPSIGELFAEKYIVESRLGEGGFGLVVRARAVDSNRPVALKILKPTTDHGYDLEQAARFLREMRAIAQLQCPYTLTLYDYGKWKGLLFMATEFVDGEDLSMMLRRRRTLPEHDVVQILYQVLQSLAEAHELGVLHRDIKPANIRVFEYEQQLMVKVLDFGLAQSIDGAESKLTATGQVIGTPRYMAPERIRDTPLTPASDIYSLGIVGIELLLGEASVVRGFGESVEIAPDAPGITPGLRAIVNRMSAIDPRARYQKAVDVLQELRLARPSAAIDVRHVPVAPPVQSRPIAERSVPAAPTRDESIPDPAANRSMLIGALVGAIVFVGAIGVMLSRSSPEPTLTPRVPKQTVVRPPAPQLVVEALDRDLGPALTTGCTAEDWPVGLQSETWFDGVTPRPWAHYAPASYDPSTPYPVLLLVLDPEVKAEELIDHLDLRKTARALDVVLLAVPISGNPIRHVDRILEQLDKRYCIDRNQVLVMAQAEMDLVVRELTCEGTVQARIYRPRREYGRDETCWDGRVVPTIALADFEMKDKSAPVDDQALEIHGCEGKPTVSDELPRMRCHSAECSTMLVVCRQSGHVHHELTLLQKYRDQLFAPPEESP